MTSAEALAVVRDSLAAVNAGICAAIGPRRCRSSATRSASPASTCPSSDSSARRSPRARRRSSEALEAGLVPVVAPLAVGPLNVNADEAAAALAVGLGAERLLFITDVPGLLLGGAVAASIRVGEAERLLDAGALVGGIVPKLRAAVGATRQASTPRSARRRCWHELDADLRRCSRPTRATT